MPDVVSVTHSSCVVGRMANTIVLTCFVVQWFAASMLKKENYSESTTGVIRLQTLTSLMEPSVSSNATFHVVVS